MDSSKNVNNSTKSRVNNSTDGSVNNAAGNGVNNSADFSDNHAAGEETHVARPFLESVARAYASLPDDLSRYCFVFPNKRAGTFFLKYLADAVGNRTVLAPEVMSSADFAERLSGRIVDSRIDLIFRLYRCYLEINGRHPDLVSEKGTLDFDRFIPWAEVVLGDFSEVDRYEVDADKLFVNVRNYREIESNFLSPEQEEVIERYFDYVPSYSGDVESFWKTACYDEEKALREESESGRKNIRKKFDELWRVLPELYHRISENLERDGMCMPGSAWRIALENIRENGGEALPWTRVVAVGFNALARAEGEIFHEIASLKDETGRPRCEYFWDATGPVLSSGETGPGKDMKRNMSHFPPPEWAEPFLEESLTDRMTPSIDIYAAPSNVAQVKLAGRRIGELAAKNNGKDITEARTAVVLPEENMLLPLLYSLPENVKHVNLTMGYSMRHTSVASFMHHLRRLLQRAVKKEGNTSFLRDDLKTFIAHPLVQALAGSDKMNALNGAIDSSHRILIAGDVISTHSPELAALLDLPDGDGPLAITDYLDNVLLELDTAIQGTVADGEENFKSVIERTQIKHQRNALSRLRDVISGYGYRMAPASVFRLADRLLAGEKVTFEGEPLKGLQIMGMLETRALDFDHLVILSLNDSVLPRRSRKRTFIPDSLRHGFMLPLSSESENLYAYYFYRLLSRVRDVTLIYDARAGEGMRSGGKSRFLMQLELLHARGHVNTRTFRFDIASPVPKAESVKKTPEVMKLLSAFTLAPDREGSRNLSASALQRYFKCQVQFYYHVVRNINDDPEPSRFIDAITQGNILHEAMLDLYCDTDRQNAYLKPQPVRDERFFRQLLDDPQRISTAVRHAVNKAHFNAAKDDARALDRKLTGSARMVAERLKKQVRAILQYDAEHSPFRLVGCEIKGGMRYPFGEKGEEVNMAYAFDRVDRVDDDFRIVDYKTGSVGLKAKEMEDIFSGRFEAKNIFQLMLYSELLRARIDKEEPGRNVSGVRLSIYNSNDIEKGDPETLPQLDESILRPVEEFRERLDAALCEIYNPEKDFVPTDDPEHCRYCRLAALCGREGWF